MGNKLVEALSSLTTSSEKVLTDLLLLNFTVVNACLVGAPSSRSKEWVLVDTGLENSGDYIIECVKSRFGEGSRPQAIILTHGHFDHVGSAIKLAELWDVPVYAHPLELPYITGQKDYPVADATVGGGLVAQMSPTFPHTRIDLGSRVVALPKDGSVPGMPGWSWIHTPGHCEGHVSLFREKDGTLLAGDAFTTIKQESLWSVITQHEQISGPPAYLTTDWESAEKSVQVLRDLSPHLVVPSHGQPMKGEQLAQHLNYLVHHFDEIAVPEQGVYVD